MNKKLLISGGIGILLLGIILVSAQVGNRISPRCNSNGIIDVDYAYKIHTGEGYTSYIAVLTAGKCERQFRGQIDRTSSVVPYIESDINNQINVRTLSFYPDPFGELEVDGRGYFSIP